jgi:hypothetical protein
MSLGQLRVERAAVAHLRAALIHEQAATLHEQAAVIHEVATVLADEDEAHLAPKRTQDQG